jgi:hypothetical protein
MAGEDVADRSPRLQRRIERVDRRTRYTESAIDPLAFENKNGCIDGAHSGHDGPPQKACDDRHSQGFSYFSIFPEFFSIQWKNM